LLVTYKSIKLKTQTKVVLHPPLHSVDSYAFICLRTN